MKWTVQSGLIPYPQAVTNMEQQVAQIEQNQDEECVWFVEHPPLYTAGTSANIKDLLDPRFPVYQTGRGGQYTYHGPGQRVVYVMMNLKNRGDKPDIRKFVWDLEEWIILTLADFGIKGERRSSRVGIWVVTQDNKAEAIERKIAAIGVRIRRWVTYHGFAINVAPDLSHFSGIVPCGITQYGVTSLADLGILATMDEIDSRLKQNFYRVFL